MNFRLLFAALFLTCFESFSQTKFEKGYFIDENGQRIECLIQLADRTVNPIQFSYKLSETSGVLTRDISNAKEFGIYFLRRYNPSTEVDRVDASRFVMFHVDMDLSADRMPDFSNVRAPQWSPAQVFLRVVVEGKAALYSYYDGHIERFFFSIDGAPPQQLIYKKYFVNGANEERKVAINSDFQNQLWTAMKCEKTSINTVKALDYDLSSLTRYFKIYNACTGGAPIDFNPELEAGPVNFYIVGGAAHRSLTIETTKDTYASKTEITGGLEVEFILPGTTGKTAILFGAMYQQYHAERLTRPSPTAKIAYSTVGFPFGARRYLYKKEKKGFFLNGLVIPDVVLMEEKTGGETLQGSWYLSVGAGITLGPLNAEFRLMSPHRIIQDYESNNYSGYSILVSYRVFRLRASP